MQAIERHFPHTRKHHGTPAITVHFFIEDEGSPVIYDYDLSVGGALTVSPMFIYRTEDVTLVMLKKAPHGPTAAQLQRIAAMRAEHPDIEMCYHFSQSRRPAASPRTGSQAPRSILS